MAAGKVYAKATVEGGIVMPTGNCEKKISHVGSSLELFGSELDRSEKLIVALESSLIRVLRQDPICEKEMNPDSPKNVPVPLAENILEGVERQRIVNNRIESVLSRLEV